MRIGEGPARLALRHLYGEYGDHDTTHGKAALTADPLHRPAAGFSATTTFSTQCAHLSSSSPKVAPNVSGDAVASPRCRKR